VQRAIKVAPADLEEAGRLQVEDLAVVALRAADWDRED
jgi:hypothetical protein